MTPMRILFSAATAALVVSVAACGTGTTPNASSSVGSAPALAPPKVISADDFGSMKFDRPTSIDNQWSPIRPGMQFVYTGHVTEDGERVAHRVVFTVTDLTKVVDGVRTVVVWDRDYTTGELVEGELAFFAQDNDGNVWLLGEYPEEYEEGKFSAAPDTWMSGLASARPGIAMRTDPAVGTPSYLQGWAPEIDFADQAKVSRVGERTCVPVDCFDDVLVTDEWNPDEPGAHQFKFYAAGVGNVRIGFGGAGEKQQESLVLAEVVRLSPEELATVRVQALKLDRRAYKSAKRIWSQTPPAEPS